MTTGGRLRAWRIRAGLSQEQAAERVGTTQRTWGAWEIGSTPEADFIEAIEKLTSGSITFRDWARSRRKKRRDDAAASAPPSGTDLSSNTAKAS
jgi:transcriptional regulator with XRE-family HTH domain